jgi:DivIVA domain-containing protein
MTWFFAVLVVLLMGAVALVAAGAGGSMAEVYDDRPDSRVQADGPLTAQDIRTVRFTTAFRGYRMSEVDALLERLAIELDAARADTARADTAERQGRPETEEGH